MSKYLLFIVAMLLVMSSASARADDGFDPTQLDKQAHMAVSYAVALTATEIMEKNDVPRWKSVLYASLGTIALGLTKEYFIDSQPSTGDIIADGVGVGVSAAVVFTFRL
jgi:hypothetical protein